VQVPVQYIHKLGNANLKPLPVVEHLVLSRPKDPSQAELSAVQPFFDMDIKRFASSMRESQPGLR